MNISMSVSLEEVTEWLLCIGVTILYITTMDRIITTILLCLVYQASSFPGTFRRFGLDLSQGTRPSAKLTLSRMRCSCSTLSKAEGYFSRPTFVAETSTAFDPRLLQFLPFLEHNWKSASASRRHLADMIQMKSGSSSVCQATVGDLQGGRRCLVCA